MKTDGVDDGGFPPSGDEQVVDEDAPDKLEVQDDQALSREDTTLGASIPPQPTRAKVTFDDGANYDKKYSGPLISFEQLCFSGEDLTDIIFCKHFNASVTGRESSAGEVASKNYLECAESILEQGIKRWLESYNRQVGESSNARIMNLVTFREALQHAARLSRALVREAFVTRQHVKLEAKFSHCVELSLRSRYRSFLWVGGAGEIWGSVVRKL